MAFPHNFHIPVMGIGYTIDTPLKVSHYGIDSVISLADDILLEKMRKTWSEKFELPYQAITENMEDFRAERITSYLNMVNDLAREKFEAFRKSAQEKGATLRKYLEMLPEGAGEKDSGQEEIAVAEKLLPTAMGSIDVNIMTKVDKVNYFKKEKQPVEYNDAHAAVRGFANSDLRSSLILSAGMNPSLYGYLANFEDFFPNLDGEVKKKIVLKVSDYRSALVQGKFLAKKGLWVSEFRIESGLNCGGHAFATEGHLMGPILAEFRDNRSSLQAAMHELFIQTLSDQGRPVPQDSLPIKLTAQGGVGTHEEHCFLLDHYQVDSVGWGTPFLLVPEATSVDKITLDKLVKAKEQDLYLSHVSPLGVPFHNLRGNTKDQEKQERIAKGKPGSPCPKRYLALNNEFTEKSLCPASRKYQRLKIQELEKQELSPEERQSEYDAIVDKACICVGLGTSAMKVHGVPNKVEGDGVSVCPGPNLAYFSHTMSLREMTDHIYGKRKGVTRNDRPNMFIKELGLYLDHLKNKVTEAKQGMTPKQGKTLDKIAGNIQEGIDYYFQLIAEVPEAFKDVRSEFLQGLKLSNHELASLREQIEVMK